MTKKKLLPLLIILIGLPGCMGFKKKPNSAKKNKPKGNISSLVDIPLADNTEPIRSFFDSDVNDFFTLEPEAIAAVADNTNESIAKSDTDKQALAKNSNDFTWIENTSEMDDNLKKVYFKFNQHAVSNNHKKQLDHDIKQAKKVLSDSRNNGVEPTIIIEGHSCRSAGSAVYNLALSEKRAKAVSDYFVENGIARENIKIVGRGYEVPEVVNGKAIEGDKEQQWPNRRSEVHIVYS